MISSFNQLNAKIIHAKKYNYLFQLENHKNKVMFRDAPQILLKQGFS